MLLYRKIANRGISLIPSRFHNFVHVLMQALTITQFLPYENLQLNDMYLCAIS